MPVSTGEYRVRIGLYRCGCCREQGLVLEDADGNGVRLTEHKMVPAYKIRTFRVTISDQDLAQYEEGDDDRRG